MRRTTDGTINVVCDGNSLTLGVGATTSYPAQLDALCSAAVTVTNLGVSGQTTNDMWSDYLTQVRPLASSRADRNVLVLWEVRNSMFGGATPRTAVDTLWTYVDRARISGWEVYVCTVIASVETGSLTDAKITEANGYIRTEAASHGCRVVDLAADARLSDENDPNYYNADKIHLVDAGYGVVAAIAKTQAVLP